MPMQAKCRKMHTALGGQTLWQGAGAGNPALEGKLRVVVGIEGLAELAELMDSFSPNRNLAPQVNCFLLSHVLPVH